MVELQKSSGFCNSPRKAQNTSSSMAGVRCRKLLCFPYGNKTGDKHVSLYLDAHTPEEGLQGTRHAILKLLIKNQLIPSKTRCKGKVSTADAFIEHTSLGAETVWPV